MNGYDDEIDAASTALIKSAQHLTQLMRKYCPGPHEMRQHRDHNPPWCKTCRRTSDGRRI
jgi:hypothetical protein